MKPILAVSLCFLAGAIYCQVPHDAINTTDKRNRFDHNPTRMSLPNTSEFLVETRDKIDSSDCDCNFIYLQLGGVPSIFNIGYGHEFNAKRKFSFEPMIGVGLGFFNAVRIPYYSLEGFVKLRHLYNFKQRHSFFVEIGFQYTLNPWYIANQPKYYTDCDNGGICPESYTNYFVSPGYQFSFKRFDFSTMLNVNCTTFGYSKLIIIPIPGIDFKYKF